MCDSSTQSAIDSIVANKISGNQMFTAFDVSLEVQKELKSNGSFDPDLHRHRYIKNDVHAAIDRLSSGVYSRQLRDVGAPTDAFVYYPNGTDPANYVPMTRNDAPAAAADPYTISIPATATAPTVPTSTDGSSDGRTPDARGTVCVPNYLLRNAGFNPGDKAYICLGKDDLGNDAIVVTKQILPSGAATCYTVDSYCNVRITKSVLDMCGFSSQKYAFDGNSSQVFVKTG